MLGSKQEELLLHGPLKFYECINTHHVTLMKLFTNGKYLPCCLIRA